MSLTSRLQRQIHQDGPMSVARYMTICLLDPSHGYYPTRDPIGAGADFITAPEVSQMFGELIGVWLAANWQKMDQPKTINLVEAGPGKGSMMSDILRASAAVPEFSQALHIHLIEASAALVAVQAKTLGSFTQPISWTDHLSDTGSGPLMLVANEYVDCLPVRQFIRKPDHWHERLIGLDEAGEFQFILDPSPLAAKDIELIAPELRNAAQDTLVEVRPSLAALFDPLAKRAETDPVMALFIDYGPAISETGDSFQAISKHKKVNPLRLSGEVDLTARVDFAELGRAARTAGFEVSAPITQGQWLQKMGLLERAAVLAAKSSQTRNKIARQVHRLSDAREMGELFKFLAVWSPGLSKPAGF